MKKIYYLLFGILMLSCSSQDKVADAINFDWMLGEWKRVDEIPNNQVTFETWQKESDKRYIGHGFVMIEEDTVWQERMQLVKQNEQWDLIVDTPGNHADVSFKLTTINDNSFLAENPQHDFPQMIKYFNKNDNLMATVGDAESSIDFKFIKLN